MARGGKFAVRIEEFDAEDVRAFYNQHALRVWHLQGKERVFRIVRYKRVIETYGGEEKTKIALYLAQGNGKELKLPFVCNPTNRDSIIALYGKKPSAWVGRLIALYPTTTEFAGKTVDCIRIRSHDPAVQRPKVSAQTVNGVNWIDQKAPQDGGKAARQQAPLDPEDDGRESGLELDLDALDAVDSAAGNIGNAYQDVTEDDSEPPPGALETDIIR